MHIAARRILTSLMATALLSGMATVVATTAEASAAAGVQCGSVISGPARMTKNLSCAADQGLTLLAGASLEMAGHKISGTGAGTAVTLPESGAATLTNGTISNWGLSFDMEGGLDPVAEVTVSKVLVSRAPAYFFGGNVTINNASTFLDSDINLSSATMTVDRSTLRRSDISGASAFVDVTNSKTVGGNSAMFGGGGITYTSSTLSGSGFDGRIADCSETSVTIVKSTVINYTQPIAGYYCSVTLQDSTFRDNRGGVLAGVTDGFQPGDVHTLVERNMFIRDGVVLASGAMVVRDNTFFLSTTGLVALDPEFTTVEGNTFRSNSDSGISTESPGLTVSGNLAVSNANYGIYAAGANDLGGNRASKNGVGQCVGVTCTK